MVEQVNPAGIKHLEFSQTDPALSQSTTSSQGPPETDLIEHFDSMQARGEAQLALTEQAAPTGKRQVDPWQEEEVTEQSEASSQTPPAGDLVAHLKSTQTRPEAHWELVAQVAVAGKRQVKPSQMDPEVAQSETSSQLPPMADLAEH